MIPRSAAFVLEFALGWLCNTTNSKSGVHLQSATPLAVLGALHFEAITDLAWSCDGSLLVIASYDGYCRCGISHIPIQ